MKKIISILPNGAVFSVVYLSHFPTCFRFRYRESTVHAFFRNTNKQSHRPRPNIPSSGADVYRCGLGRGNKHSNDPLSRICGLPLRTPLPPAFHLPQEKHEEKDSSLFLQLQLREISHRITQLHRCAGIGSPRALCLVSTVPSE